MLTDNKKLYEDLERALRTFYADVEYMYIHAIYEPDEVIYDSAVDIHEPGETYHVYFTINDDASIIINGVERWFMG